MKTSVVRIYRMPRMDDNSHFTQTRLHLIHILGTSHTFFERPVVATGLDTAGFKGEHVVFYGIVKGDGIIGEWMKSETSRSECIKLVLMNSR